MKSSKINFTTLLGASFAIAVVYLGGIKAVKNPMMFLDTHAILLVVGGTLAATLLAYPVNQLTQLVDFILFGVFSRKKTDYISLVEEMAEVNLCMKTHNPNIRYKEFSHFFLKEGVNLLHEKTYTYDDVSDILEDRASAFKNKYQQDAKILNAIAKYPPAFGLLGATTGMISMMTNLGGPGGTAAIGQAMAVALVATFWGIATANFVFLPLADHAQKAFIKDEFTRNFIKEGILLIKKGTNQRVFIERLCSMLSLEERVLARSQNANSMAVVEGENIIDLFQKRADARMANQHQVAAQSQQQEQMQRTQQYQASIQNPQAGAPEAGLNFKNVKTKKHG